MNAQKLAKLNLAFLTASLLAACGGGGGSPAPAPAATPTPAPTPVAATPTPAPPPAPAAVSFAKADADAWAKLGLTAAETAFLSNTSDPLFFGILLNVLSSSSTATGSVPTSSLACSGAGTQSIAQTKAGTYVGYKAGDKLVLGFTNCRVTGSTVVNNGTVTLTLNADAILPTAASVINFKMDALNYAAITSAGTLTSNGSMNVLFGGFNGVSAAYDITTTAATDYVSTLNSPTSGTGNFTQKLGTVIKTKLTTALGFSNSISGTYTLAVSGGAIPFIYSTPSTLTGTVASASARQVPTSGAINIGPNSAGLTTQIAINGTPVTVTYNNSSASTPNTSYQTTYLTLVP